MKIALFVNTAWPLVLADLSPMASAAPTKSQLWATGAPTRPTLRNLQIHDTDVPPEPTFNATDAPSSSTDFVLLKRAKRCSGVWDFYSAAATSVEDCAAMLRNEGGMSNMNYGSFQCAGYKKCSATKDDDILDLYSLTQADLTELQSKASCAGAAVAHSEPMRKARCADFCSDHAFFVYKEDTRGCYCYDECDIVNAETFDVYSVVDTAVGEIADPTDTRKKERVIRIREKEERTIAAVEHVKDPAVLAKAAERSAKINETLSLWTPELRAEAKPLDMRTMMDPFNPNGQGQLKNANPGRHLFGTGANQTWYDPEKSISNDHWKGVDQQSFTGTMSEATGRLFFFFDAVLASCSGTAVRDYSSSDRSLIVTAAHCIYDERNKIFATNVLFIPNQDDGGTDVGNLDCFDDPFGCWVADFGVVDSEWANNLNDVTHDFGFYVVQNQGSHSGEGGRDLVLEDTVKTVDMDWNNKAELEENEYVYTMGYPGRWNTELRYAKGPLKKKQNLQFVYGCTLTEGSSGGPMPINPYADNPELFSVSSFKSGYFEDGEFIQTACGGPLLHGNSYCSLLVAAEEANLLEASIDGGVILPYANDGCVLPGSCRQNNDCDDGVFCNGLESCVDGFCVTGSDPCGGTGCEEDFGCLPPCTSDFECDDGIFCNGEETCNNGTCVAGPGNPCGEGEMCDPIVDTCAHAECIQDNECNDGVFCNGKEMCVQGQCYFGEPPCEAHEKCDEISQTCPLTICSLIQESDYCVLDNECCVSLYECGPQETTMAECVPHLFSTERIEPAYTWIDEQGAFGATSWPTCLWNYLFVDAISGGNFKTIQGDPDAITAAEGL